MTRRSAEACACSCGWQVGGGVQISGIATLTNTNVYRNIAISVSPFEPAVMCSPLPPAAGTLARAHGWLTGRGTRRFGHSNDDQHQGVFQRRILGVLSSRTCRDVFSVARWDKSGTTLVSMCGWQHGGGLRIQGTATLTNTNVYKNRVFAWVCSPAEPSSLNSQPAPRVLMVGICTGRRTPNRQGRHGNADQHQRVPESGRLGVLAC